MRNVLGTAAVVLLVGAVAAALTLSILAELKAKNAKK